MVVEEAVVAMEEGETLPTILRPTITTTLSQAAIRSQVAAVALEEEEVAEEETEDLHTQLTNLVLQRPTVICRPP